MKIQSILKLIFIVPLPLLFLSNKTNQEFKFSGLYGVTQKNCCYNFQSTKKCVISGISHKYVVEDSIVTFSLRNNKGSAILRVLDYSADSVTFLSLNYSVLYFPNTKFTIKRVEECEY